MFPRVRALVLVLALDVEKRPPRPDGPVGDKIMLGKAGGEL